VSEIWAKRKNSPERNFMPICKGTRMEDATIKQSSSERANGMSVARMKQVIQPILKKQPLTSQAFILLKSRLSIPRRSHRDILPNIAWLIDSVARQF
jgi:hypothetical protein